MSRILNAAPQGNQLTNLTQSSVAYSYLYDAEKYDAVAIQTIYTDATPTAKSFVAANVNATTDIITIAGHGFNTGLKVALTGTNLPGGLSATNYWVIVKTVNTIQLATSLANAVAGTQVDITSAGTTADAALTAVTLATTGQTLKLQESVDGINFVDISGDNVIITTAGTTIWHVTPWAQYINLVLTPSTGAINLSVLVDSRTLHDSSKG
jgi:hypothetical protein